MGSSRDHDLIEMDESDSIRKRSGLLGNAPPLPAKDSRLEARRAEFLRETRHAPHAAHLPARLKASRPKKEVGVLKVEMAHCCLVHAELMSAKLLFPANKAAHYRTNLVLEVRPTVDE